MHFIFFSVKVRGANLTFRYCPPGEFTMNVYDFSDKYLAPTEIDEDDEDLPEKPIRVKITRGFWIQETELTRKQAVAISCDQSFSRSEYDDGVPRLNGSYPFWGSRAEFQRMLKDLNSDGTMFDANVTPHGKIAPDGWEFAFPTEAEWEYASRAGSDDPESDDDTEKYAWTSKNSGEVAHKVASKKANKWGLYDMRGNMWELVRVPEDHMSTELPDQQILDADGTLHDPDNLRGGFQVVKGGGIGMDDENCKSETWSYYEGKSWSFRTFDGDIGGRIALVEKDSIPRPERKQIVLESGFERWRRQQREETDKWRQELRERREREERAAASDPNYKTPQQEMEEMQERVEKARRDAEDEQAAMQRQEIENVMRDQNMTEEQAKEFLADMKERARKADEEFDKEHGLDSIDDPVERSRRRYEIRTKESGKHKLKRC